jgi:short-subunit dehydrogenase
MKNYKAILITGASSGIGRAVAEIYAENGVTLLLTGRDTGRMEETADFCRRKGAAVEIAMIDVTEREILAKQVLLWDDRHQIDLIIANAGISGGTGRSAAEGEEIFREIMRINTEGTFNTVGPLISRMQARKGGQIAVMGSMAGFRGMPSAVAYSISKNAVRAYAEAMRPLLKKDSIGVSIICPGFIRTPLTGVNKFPMPFLMEPEEAARKIRQGLAVNRAVIAFPWQVFLFIRFVALLPRWLGDFILSKAPSKE